MGFAANVARYARSGQLGAADGSGKFSRFVVVEAFIRGPDERSRCRSI